MHGAAASLADGRHHLVLTGVKGLLLGRSGSELQLAAVLAGRLREDRVARSKRLGILEPKKIKTKKDEGGLFLFVCFTGGTITTTNSPVAMALVTV